MQGKWQRLKELTKRTEEPAPSAASIDSFLLYLVDLTWYLHLAASCPTVHAGSLYCPGHRGRGRTAHTKKVDVRPRPRIMNSAASRG